LSVSFSGNASGGATCFSLRASLAPAPAPVSQGGGIATAIGLIGAPFDSVYATRGGGTTDFGVTVSQKTTGRYSRIRPRQSRTAGNRRSLLLYRMPAGQLLTSIPRWNICFGPDHFNNEAGATLRYRRSCPGAVTALLLYLPLWRSAEPGRRFLNA